MIGGSVSYKGAIRYLQKIAKQELFATASALTTTAVNVKDEETRALSRYLKNPTPFTRRAYRWERATKQRLVSAVYAAGVQAEYLSAQIHGGTTKGHVPGKPQKLNQYGNLPRNATKRKGTFNATIGGVYGTWQAYGPKKNRKVRLVAHYPSARHYKARLPFYDVAEKVVARKFGSNYAAAFRRAVATAR